MTCRLSDLLIINIFLLYMQVSFVEVSFLDLGWRRWTDRVAHGGGGDAMICVEFM